MPFQRSHVAAGLLIASLCNTVHPVSAEQSVSLSNGGDRVSPQPGAIAQPYCFIQTADNRIINLNKLCGSSTALTPLDRVFLSFYQTSFNQRLAALPSSARVKRSQSQEEIVIRAKQACAEIAAGRLAEVPNMTPGVIDADIVNKLALKYYCPELDD